MKYLKAVVVAICLCGTALVTAQDEYKRAAQLYKEGKFQDAIVVAEEAVASHPNWYYPIMLKGQCNFKLKKYQDAIRNFNDSLTLVVPNEYIPVIKYYIASSYMGLKDYPKAINAWDDLLPIAPDKQHFDCYLNRGQAEIQIAKAAEASGDNEKANSYYSKSIISFSKALENKIGKAEAEIEAAFQKAFAQYKIGNVSGGVKSLEDSIKAFEQVLELEPKEERAHSFLITLAFNIVEKTPDSRKAEKYEQAVQYIDRYLKHWPNNVDMLTKKGLALQGAKRFRDAVETFKLVTKLQPKNGEVWFSLGSCEMAAKNYQNAIGHFEKALSLGEKDNPALYTYYAYCYQEQMNRCAPHDIPLYEKAVGVLEKGIAALSGQAKAVLQRELEQKKTNLQILRDNMVTDKQNHANTIENITSLAQVISKNEDVLSKNQERYISQPTEELQAAIDEGKAAILRDREKLNQEIEQARRYVEEARRCGGQAASPHFDELVELIKQHS